MRLTTIFCLSLAIIASNAHANLNIDAFLLLNRMGKSDPNTWRTGDLIVMLTQYRGQMGSTIYEVGADEGESIWVNVEDRVQDFKHTTNYLLRKADFAYLRVILDGEEKDPSQLPKWVIIGEDFFDSIDVPAGRFKARRRYAQLENTRIKLEEWKNVEAVPFNNALKRIYSEGSDNVIVLTEELVYFKQTNN